MSLQMLQNDLAWPCTRPVLARLHGGDAPGARLVGGVLRRLPSLVLLGLALIGGLLTQAQAETVTEVQRRFVTIGTGGPSGVYFAAGNAMCRIIHQRSLENLEQNKPFGLRCLAPATGGSIDNIARLISGDLDFAMVQSDLQYQAYRGTASERVKHFPELRAVFSVHAEPFHLIVGKNTNIRRFADLRGKRVNIGNPGSGQQATMEMLMLAYGITAKDFAVASTLTSSEQSNALCDDRIDAYVFTVGVPSSGVAVAVEGCGARIVSLNGEVERRLVASTPYLAFATIPARTYGSDQAEVTTFGVTATLVTRASEEDRVVYEFVRTVIGNIDDFRILHPAFAQLDPKRMIRDGLSAPLHPGALRYYRERGWM
jgi:hypothetical protein